MKKFLSLLLVLVLCMSAVTCFAAPAGPGPNGGPAAEGPKPPKPGEPKPPKVGPKEVEKAYQIVAAANAQIASYVAYAQSTPEDDVAWLIAITNAVAAKAISEVAALGLTAVCSYTTYIVDGQSVDIDPLNVVNDPTKPRPPISTQLGDGK